MYYFLANYFFICFKKNMSINFTGIKNLDIKTFRAKGYGFYVDNACQIAQGDKYYTVVSIKGDLDNTVIKGENNSQEGFKTHLVQYINALQKLKRFDLIQRFVNFECPENIEIIMKHFYAPDNLGDINQASFILNGQQIPLVHRNILPLYSFMARTTKDILRFFDISPQTRASVKLVNKSIAQTAEEFIENMNL